MEALQRGKRRRGDWTQASVATNRPGGGATAPAFPKLPKKLGSTNGRLRPSAHTPVAPSAPAGRPSPATSPLDEPSAVQSSESVGDKDDPDDFELSLSEESDDETLQQCGRSNAPLPRSPLLPTVAEAAAFVAAAVASSPRARTESNTEAATGAAATISSHPDAAQRLAALLEKRPKLKVVKTTKNKLSSRELAGLSDDEDDHGEGGGEAARVAADAIRRRREARLAAQNAMAAETASSDRAKTPSNSPAPLTFDLT